MIHPGAKASPPGAGRDAPQLEHHWLKASAAWTPRWGRRTAEPPSPERRTQGQTHFPCQLHFFVHRSIERSRKEIRKTVHFTRASKRPKYGGAGALPHPQRPGTFSGLSARLTFFLALRSWYTADTRQEPDHSQQCVPPPHTHTHDHGCRRTSQIRH